MKAECSWSAAHRSPAPEWQLVGHHLPV